MRLLSTAFQDGKLIPTRNAHRGVTGGQNISFQLDWSDPPPTVQSFALSIIDLHPVAKNWGHWFVVNIPKNITSFAEGASGKNMPSGSKELYNSFGEIGYGGPQPPKGSGPHPYEVTVYALNVEKLDLSANATLPAFKKALEGKVIATAKTTGIYER